MTTWDYDVILWICGFPFEEIGIVLVLDNWWNLGLTFDLSVWIRKGGPTQVVKLNDGYGEGDGSHLEKKKEKNKNKLKEKV